jgi:hypothetical protein
VRELALGLAALGLAAAYWVEADGIRDSLLSDAVGAGGMPKALAVIMGGAGALLALRSVFARRATVEDRPAPAHGRAAGLFAMLVAYVLLAPVLGYLLALGLLAASVALYAGAPARPGLVAFAAGVAALFWLGFVKLLGVAFPTGTLFGGA